MEASVGSRKVPPCHNMPPATHTQSPCGTPLLLCIMTLHSREC